MSRGCDEDEASEGTNKTDEIAHWCFDMGQIMFDTGRPLSRLVNRSIYVCTYVFSPFRHPSLRDVYKVTTVPRSSNGVSVSPIVQDRYYRNVEIVRYFLCRRREFAKIIGIP